MRRRATSRRASPRRSAWYLANEPWWRAVMDGSYRRWIDRNYGERTATA